MRLVLAEAAPLGEEQGLLGTAPSAAYETARPEEDPFKRAALLNRALAANPRNTAARIELGLLLEAQGETDDAEASLLEAARFDHQHLPAWTLANFYFRHQRQPEFWSWARETARLNSDDFRPLLRLAYALEPDPNRLLERLGDPLEYSLLDVLIEKDRLDQAQQLARILMARPNAKREAMLGLSTRQIAHGNASAALELWNWLHPPADPLAEPPDGEGFRPKLIANPGVEADWNPGRIVFRFDGTESDVFPLLEQAVAVPVTVSRYRLLYELSGPAEGLNFSLGGAFQPVLGSAARFSLPAAYTNLDRLRIVQFRLYYHRAPGVIPLQGELTIRNLHLIREEP